MFKISRLDPELQLTFSLRPEEAWGGAGYLGEVLSIVDAVPTQGRLAAAFVTVLLMSCQQTDSCHLQVIFYYYNLVQLGFSWESFSWGRNGHSSSKKSQISKCECLFQNVNAYFQYISFELQFGQLTSETKFVFLSMASLWFANKVQKVIYF